jgi:hypothetical protein
MDGNRAPVPLFAELEPFLWVKYLHSRMRDLYCPGVSPICRLNIR